MAHEVISRIRRQAIPLSGVVPGRGVADLRALKEVFGHARLVALGEATHGTREFFQLKHRLLEYLVVELGFTTFAVEANWPECQAVNRYVLHGVGDPAQLLADLGFWTLDTEELLDLLLWMRKHNASSSRDRQVTFAGFDAQLTARSAQALREYLDRVDPAFAAGLAPRLALFDSEAHDYSDLSAAEVDDRLSLVEELSAHLEHTRAALVARSDSEEWRLARQHARIMHQVHAQRSCSDARLRYLLRDRAMADNAAWLFEGGGARSKMVLWAHNAHVARDPRGIFDGDVVSMGMHLARTFGDDLVVTGFVFDRGEFRAVAVQGDYRPIRGVEVGAAPRGSLDTALASTGLPAFLLDLRRVDRETAEWLQQSRVTREVGALYFDEEDMRQTIVPAARYDVVAFVAATSSTRPNPR